MTLNGSVLISIFGSAFSTIEGRKKNSEQEWKENFVLKKTFIQKTDD